MNTTESAAAVSGDPAAAAIMIQTKMTGSSLPSGRSRPPCRGRGTDGTICAGRHRARLPLRQVSAEYRFDGQVPGQLAQVGPGLRGVGGRGPLLEFLQRQPAFRVRVPEDVDNALALPVGRADRSVGHRHGPFLVFL